MKNIKVHILISVIILSNSALLQGMLRSSAAIAARQRVMLSKVRPSQLQTVRTFATQQPKQTSAQLPRTNVQPRESQPWMERLKDWWYGPQQQPITQALNPKALPSPVTPPQNMTVQKPNATITIVAEDAAVKKDCDMLLNNIEKKLNAIKPNRKQLNELAVSELVSNVQKTVTNAFITCPDPTEEIRHLLKMKSLSSYEKYIKNKKRSILKKMGFTKEQVSELENLINSNIAQFMEQYKQAKGTNDFDRELYGHQLDVAEYLLKKAGIEPSSISIRSTTRNPQLVNLGGAITSEAIDPKQTIPDAKNLSLYIRQVLNLKPYPYHDNSNTFMIAHEIGHLVKGHMPELIIIRAYCCSKYNVNAIEKLPDKIKNLFQKLDTLNEIDADLWYATIDQDIAKIARDDSLFEVRSKHSRPDIYLTPSNKLYISTKILQLHEKAAAEKLPQQTPSLEPISTEKE